MSEYSADQQKPMSDRARSWLVFGGIVLLVALIAMWQRSQQQTYWYCYDTGAANPHHLGHVISGDHLCSSTELGIDERDVPLPGE